MLALSALASIASLSVLAAATAISDDHVARDINSSLSRRQIAIPANMCAGALVCCQSFMRASDPPADQILQLLGINLAPGYYVGLTCTPISAISVTPLNCAAQPLCCTWASGYGGVVAIDCTPVY
ncbi:hypothetical protein CPC08DRAFT_706175 [Agrocybe pediades]|nr:hypothetical protein CPC08DRAFT_706175 [Agrocybe pediades]